MNSKTPARKLLCIFLSVVMVVTLQVPLPRDAFGAEGGGADNASSMSSAIAGEGAAVNKGAPATALTLESNSCLNQGTNPQQAKDGNIVEVEPVADGQGIASLNISFDSSEPVVEEVLMEEVSTLSTNALPDEIIRLESYVETQAQTIVYEALNNVVEDEQELTLPPENARYWNLNEIEQGAYLDLKDAFEKVASGTLSSTSVQLPFYEILPQSLLTKGDAGFTASDLGLEKVW